MTEASSLSVFAVLLLAAIVLIQTLAIVAFNFRLVAKLRRLEPKLLRATGKSLGHLDRAEELLERLQPIPGKFPGWGENISRWAASIDQSLASIDETAERLLSIGREQTRNVDEKTDVLLLRFSEKAAQVQKTVSSPAHQVSAAVVALKAAFGRYFASRNETSPYDFPADQDSFI